MQWNKSGRFIMFILIFRPLQKKLQLQPTKVICITNRIFAPSFLMSNNEEYTMKTVLCLVDLILSRWEINWRCNTTITLLSSFVPQQSCTYAYKKDKKKGLPAFILLILYWSMWCIYYCVISCSVFLCWLSWTILIHFKSILFICIIFWMYVC